MTSCRSPVPSSGCTFEQNVVARDIVLSVEDLAAIEKVAPKGVAVGERYQKEHMARVNV